MRDRYLLYATDLREGMMGVAIFPSGASSVDLTGSHGPGQEIGQYERALPEGTYERVLGIMRGVGLDALPPSDPVPPETKMVSVGEVKVGEVKVGDVTGGSPIKGYPLYAIPQALAPLLQEMEACADEIRKHPVRVLRGASAPFRAPFLATGPVVFEVILRGVGRRSLLLDNPFGKDPAWGHVRLLVAADKPAAQLREGEFIQVDIKPENLRTVGDDDEAPSGKKISLNPGEEARFLVRKRLLLKPGAYRAALTYYTTRGRLGAEALKGSLTMDAGSFDVVDAAPERQK